MIALWLAGCITAPLGLPLPAGDPDVFAAEVQPVLAACANPSCHGSADRPLEVYAVHLHRLEPDEVFRDLPLSDEELFLNQVRATAFLSDPAWHSELVRKPLHPDAGGMAHVAGAQFLDTTNPDYQVLLAWIESAVAEETP